jgi:D-lactate dehydrogenase (cytochrome)
VHYHSNVAEDRSLAPYLEDAAHFPGGHAAGIVFPRNATEVAEALAAYRTILPIGAQSSLTGGATPMGETILSTSRMRRIVEVGRESVTVEPGVTIAELQEVLRETDAWFAPAPTFTGACAGGVVATNAAGAATFKYGSTRPWVQALRVVLSDGTMLHVVRGRTRAVDYTLRVETRSGSIEVPVPRYQLPHVPKVSAGYHAAPDLDLIDLFIGSEGTLGVIAEITFRVLRPAPAVALAFVPCRKLEAALHCVGALRVESLRTRAARDPAGIDAAAIEHMDRRSLEIVREDGADRAHNVSIPSDSELALLVQLELPPDTTDERAFDDIQNATDATPLGRFCRLLDAHGLLADCEIALPGQRRRMADFIAVREAVPAGVNRRVGDAKRTIDPRIEKTAGDMIVPFEHFGRLLEIYRDGLARRGLDFAVWGHISDGNVHPNVIPRSLSDVELGKEAMIEFGAAVAQLGGCPLAEHGVGRNPVKQQLLQNLYGAQGIEQMRAVKRALDPEWKLAPGVVFGP